MMLALIETVAVRVGWPAAGRRVADLVSEFALGGYVRTEVNGAATASESAPPTAADPNRRRRHRHAAMNECMAAYRCVDDRIGGGWAARLLTQEMNGHLLVAMGRVAGVTAEETRQKLLTAATAAFESQGFEGTRVADIAGEAGVSNGALYSHFGSKGELLAAALHDKGHDELSSLFLEHPDHTDARPARVPRPPPRRAAARGRRPGDRGPRGRPPQRGPRPAHGRPPP